jgi:hypothetical protein
MGTNEMLLMFTFWCMGQYWLHAANLWLFLHKQLHFKTSRFKCGVLLLFEICVTCFIMLNYRLMQYDR